MTTLNDLVKLFKANKLKPEQRLIIRDGKYSSDIWVEDVINNTEYDKYRDREVNKVGDTWFLNTPRL